MHEQADLVELYTIHNKTGRFTSAQPSTGRPRSLLPPSPGSTMLCEVREAEADRAALATRSADLEAEVLFLSRAGRFSKPFSSSLCQDNEFR